MAPNPEPLSYALIAPLQNPFWNPHDTLAAAEIPRDRTPETLKFPEADRRSRRISTRRSRPCLGPGSKRKLGWKV